MFCATTYQKGHQFPNLQKYFNTLLTLFNTINAFNKFYLGAILKIIIIGNELDTTIAPLTVWFNVMSE